MHAWVIQQGKDGRMQEACPNCYNYAMDMNRFGQRAEGVDRRRGQGVDVGLRVQRSRGCSGEGPAGIEGYSKDGAVPRAGVPARPI